MGLQELLSPLNNQNCTNGSYTKSIKDPYTAWVFDQVKKEEEKIMKQMSRMQDFFCVLPDLYHVTLEQSHQGLP